MYAALVIGVRGTIHEVPKYQLRDRPWMIKATSHVSTSVNRPVNSPWTMIPVASTKPGSAVPHPGQVFREVIRGCHSDRGE